MVHQKGSAIADPLLFDDDLIFRHERSPRQKMVHQRLVLELTLKATRITDTIPWFDADTWRLFVVGTPERNQSGEAAD